MQAPYGLVEAGTMDAAAIFARPAPDGRFAHAPAEERLRLARAALETVPDPEIPVVSIRELGILRDVVMHDDGAVEAVITPTYSGCPAMSQIVEDVGAALDAAGIGDWRVRTVLAPAWSTDWITAEGRDKLRAFGIAPPGRCGDEGKTSAGGNPGARDSTVQPLRFVPRAARGSSHAPVACPHCGSRHTEAISQFASTACKALYRCLDCREPFDYFKPY